MVRKIRAKRILQLRAEDFSGRQIASQGMSRNSVAEVFNAADRAGVIWEGIAEKSDAEVYAMLFPGRGEHVSVYVQPEWDKVHRELARVGVTLKLLHAEYVDHNRRKHTPVMGYDRFCKAYAQHVLIAGAASRVGHKAGQTVEVDWSGPTMRLTDPVTRKHTRVYLFVGCLPFSRYAFVEPTLDMKQDTWLRSHVAMFEWFGGSVPRIIPDNLKTGVIKNPREGEVVLNDAYRELAAHYSAAVLPARVKKPKDKPSVENTVGTIATWVIAMLRHQEFATLGELKQAVYAQMRAFNKEPFQKREGSRQSAFESEEQPLLRSLPVVSYELSRWVYGRRVQKHGHVVWQKNFYSVPYTHIGKSVDLRVTASLVEIFLGAERLSSHTLVPRGITNEYRSHPGDLPKDALSRHWDAERCREWATRIGEHTLQVVNRIFESVPIEEQGINPALAVLRLTKRYSAARVEQACNIALESRVRSPRYVHLKPILDTRQDETGNPNPRFEKSSAP